ncbi:MAG TPA: NACHT domain-containing protein [Longimicrobiaceae bacterium]|nr:NACHT domain-containing protein [Longimicrobiaceae bacterium]
MTIEGATTAEAMEDPVDAGEELIDVGLYFGAEARDDARLIRYIQLKHSTRKSLEPWTASGLKGTIKGFAERFAELLQCYPAHDVAERFRFEFTTNRPIDAQVRETLSDIAAGRDTRYSHLRDLLVGYTTLEADQAGRFFRLFSAEGGESDLWAQRNLLSREFGAYLPEADYDAPVQLKELVTRKATTEFEADPAIRRHDVLRALKVSEDELQPAPSLIPDSVNTLPREQEQAILGALLTAAGPVVIHADGGVGKSVLAARLAVSMPAGSEAILYDCFGDGLYRNALHFRHRHRDALVQIANELAARGLCHPLIPTAHADAKQYMRAFVGRLSQAARLLQATNPEALLCLIVDAADNAEMVAEELGESGSFIRDLIRVPLPTGVRLAFTCRSHRRRLLRAPLETQEIELCPFNSSESARHLRSVYPFASDAEVAEFAFLSSSNPRVQALALSRDQTLPEMLKQLGPEPTTVDRAIGTLLDSAVARLRDQAGPVEVSQIDIICQALAVLRPLVPIPTLAQLSQTSESAVRSFALDLGRPLLVKGNSLHFLDEPAETWFRERFRPDTAALTRFTELLRPLTAQSSYAAAVLPQLLLQAGQLDELVDLALSGEGLPIESPLERRDVELQRLTFALKACLQQGRHLEAAKLSLKAGGEYAGEERQNKLIQDNTDVAAVLMAPSRIEEIVSRRTFDSGWMGSHHAYDAGLLSGRPEFSAEAASRLRMALDWLNTWARLPEDERRGEHMSDADLAELAMALLRLRNAKAATSFLRGWRPRRVALTAGQNLAKRLIDIGDFARLDALAEAAGNDIWLLLGLATEARAVGHVLPAAPLARALRLLGDRRVKLSETQEWDAKWSMLNAVSSVLELAMGVLPRAPEVWADILRRYLPDTPPSDLASRFGSSRVPLVRAYALEAALRERKLALVDLAPSEVRKQLEKSNQYGHSEETETFQREVGGLLPWFVLSAEITCGRMPPSLAEGVEAAVKETRSAGSRTYSEDDSVWQAIALEWLKILRDAGAVHGPEREAFASWLAKTSLLPDTEISLCRVAGHAAGLESVAVDSAVGAYHALESIREDAESQANSYIRLARAILIVSPAEAGAYFSRAVEIASRLGDENFDRWQAYLSLAEAAGERENPRPQTAYRLSRAAELTYEYVSRDKHFDWDGTVEALADLCASSALAILSRWRDRRFGDSGRLLPLVIYRLMEHGRLPANTPVVFAGKHAGWNRVRDLRRALEAEIDPVRRAVAAQIGYRYMRLQSRSNQDWSELDDLKETYKLEFLDIDRLITFTRSHDSEGDKRVAESVGPPVDREERSPDWDVIFGGIDLTDADGLRSAYSLMRTYDPPYRLKAFFRAAFERVRIGCEPELVRAIAMWPDFGMFELEVLLDALPSPLPRPLSLRNAVRDAVLTACRHEPERVRRRVWGTGIPFEKLDAEGLVRNADVIRAALEGFAARVDSLGASGLFHLSRVLAGSIRPAEADEALNYGLDLLEDVLRSEDGDGPWRPELQPSESVISSLAGYIWVGLGSPVSAERWEYAHVVRSVVEMGWTELLEALIAWAGSGAAAPFTDHRLEFYVWHARQWLLIGLARGGLENALALSTATPLLQGWVREDHVLIRELAAQALRTLAGAGELKNEGLGDLDSINRPSLPEEVYTGWQEPVEDEDTVSEEILEDAEKYHFGIDIGPYWFAPLGRAFGLSEGAIERHARDALRQRLNWGGSSGWKQDARHTQSIFKESETYHSHGSLPKMDDLAAYHGYHAMMLVAATLLKKRRVRRSAEESVDEFREWLSEHLLTRADGRWLADRRDPRLSVDPPPSAGYGDKVWCWSVTTEYLDQQLETDDGCVVLWGYWRSGESDRNDETVSIRSALVSRLGAEALVAAFQTAPELGRWGLPSAGEGSDLEAGALKLRGWVTDEHISAGLDEADPWSEGLHYPALTPSEDTITSVGMSASMDERTWTTSAEGFLRSETWTHSQGYGRERDTISGRRLSGNVSVIRQLLAAQPGTCLLFAVQVRRRPPRGRGDEPEFEPYPQPYARYYLMEDDGVAHAL